MALPIGHIERHKGLEQEPQPSFLINWLGPMFCIMTPPFSQNYKDGRTSHGWKGSWDHLNILYILPEEEEFCFVPKKIWIETYYSRW